MSENVQDYRKTEIGRQNWEVCQRMLMHDLIDMSVNFPCLDRLLKLYRVGYTQDGGYTMALPRMGSIGKSGLNLSWPKTEKTKGKKK